MARIIIIMDLSASGVTKFIEIYSVVAIIFCAIIARMFGYSLSVLYCTAQSE